MQKPMQLTVIGTGYVGLVSGTCFAELGHHVTCIDTDAKKIEALHKGIIPIYEPGLEDLVKRHSKSGRLKFTTDAKSVVPNADAVFIAVGTPPDGDEGGADLQYVYAVAKELAGMATDGTVIITKSTVPVGTGDTIKRIIKETNPQLQAHVASNPEFLREGCAVKDFLEPDRVVVGTESLQAKSIMAQLYEPLTNQGVKILFSDIRTAELTKYAANAFLATKIAFINEIADLCEKCGANIEEVAAGMGMDHRIGRNYLSPGPGFGGSCFPKDTLALRKISRDAGAPSKVVDAVIESNLTRKKAMAEKIFALLGGKEQAKGKKVAFLGLAFKANTDDMRHSPTLYIIPKLVEAGMEIHAYDPAAMEQCQKEIAPSANMHYVKSAEEAYRNADIVVVATEWEEFRNLDWQAVKQIVKSPRLLDLRNLLKPEEMRDLGFTYSSIGRE
jgi:UDPglucose 6-dehydrogenase